MRPSGKRNWIQHATLIVVFFASAFLVCADLEGPELREGGIVRGTTNQKKIALEFTADSFGEGSKTILDALAKRKLKASFFFTGNFLRAPENKKIIQRLIKDGHYLGPHSDSHTLLCPWTGPKETLVSKEFFQNDLKRNVHRIHSFGVDRSQIKFFLPPYEWYNEEIVDWTRELGLTLINHSPGTRSSADYTEDGASNFVSSHAIMESILKKEKEDPHGLNGFLLLMHFGAGPKRTDKLFDHLGELLDSLQAKSYQFVRVDELLAN